MKKIYLVGSLRNAKVPNLANAFRDRGFDVFDDWYGAGHEADDKWQEYENLRGRKYRDALAGHAAQHIFQFDKTHINASDAIVLVLPAGKSGHLEFGYARGKRKAAVILLDGEPERFDVMYNFAHLVTPDFDEAVKFITEWRAPKSDPAAGTAAVIAELQLNLLNANAASSVYIDALAKIAHSSAQNGEDAMRMRAIATKIFNPER